ncbi:MAG: NACHT domain-containing NTPase [Symploca sp. SIO1C4]|uniref:NACHT domain-containing NTPase n=1 Tax=Symploca sp. SIO1C4 TaxID=2607765 RepID=A0A6B3NDZ8_9CYAN|nr:NACHT domain-containing NTPase [Symploca sp. SIO1C4]
MASRSLQASEQGIKKAKQAFERKGWTQEYLAGEVGIETRQPIWKFFKGKPVDRHIFNEICFRLDLEPEEITVPPKITTLLDEELQDGASKIEELAAKVRSHHRDKIQDQCGTLRLLDIARPINLDDLYVDLNVLEEITNQRWLGISDLESFSSEEFDRFGLGKIKGARVPGLEAVERYAKLMVLGKPGAGKTTFLQYLAIQCNQGNFKADCIPVFIRLKNFAEDAADEGNFDLRHYIHQEFESYSISEQELELLLSYGKILMLLDGLDEVPEALNTQVIQQIRKFSDKYYKNQLVLTCRIAAQEYRFRGFTEVEIADFKPAQIENFAKKWFVALAKNPEESGLKKASLFLEQMALPENQPIRELAATPVLLNLTCLVFQSKAQFPAKRSDLYKQGLDILLIRWDEARGVKRDHIYRNLSLSNKLELLSQLAAITFEQGRYFFEESTIGELIADYLRTLPKNQVNAPSLELDSTAVVKSIEAQHGLLVERARQIYSFSHLTFQEYFTARYFVIGASNSLPKLVAHLTEKRWREVFLLTAQMLPKADMLLPLMQQALERLNELPVYLSKSPSGAKYKPDKIAVNEISYKFLSWVSEKSLALKTPYKSAAVRAFYFTLALPPSHSLAGDQALTLLIEPQLGGKLEGELALDLALVHALGVALALTPELFPNRLTALSLALDFEHLMVEESIKDSLTEVKQQLPKQDQNQDSLKEWWQVNGTAWVSQLRTTMIEQRDIGHKWLLDQKAQKFLEEYYYANKLIVECLNSNCQLTSVVRQEIEEKLLLACRVY